MRRRTGWALAGVVALGWGEWLNGRWSRALVGPGGGGSEAVVVLGYRNPQATANFVNRWRVRAGLRSVADSNVRDTRVIFSGGTTGTGAAEARLMADYAKSVLGFDGTVVLEDQSGTTWENVTNVIPLLEGADRIKIASQPAHALKARAYLRRQRPDLAERLVRSADYRPGEWLIGKPLLALYGLWTLRGLTGEERRIPRQPAAVAPSRRSRDLSEDASGVSA
ncbi:YdcF family protein [Amycolatopsis sp. NPDC049253]|uniref:YdcF family protein n=1 Tax=Amycolatopsis sp. NPDC049253 TaxID=3155274 RepID=UPI00342BA026